MKTNSITGKIISQPGQDEINTEPIIENEQSNVSKKTENFLIKSADARMMDREEGKLAKQKGTTPDIRDYGELMIADQTMLLAELQKVANTLQVPLPAELSDKKEHFRKKLSEEEGVEFDNRFIRMITIDHKRDIRMFKRATKSEDEAVKDFAKKYLPLIESHLQKINAIRGESEK